MGRIAFGQIQRALEFLGGTDGARQDHAVIGGAHFDLFAGQDLAQTFLEFRYVGRHAHLDIGNQLARSIQQRERGHARRFAQHIDGAVRK